MKIHVLELEDDDKISNHSVECARISNKNSLFCAFPTVTIWNEKENW